MIFAVQRYLEDYFSRRSFVDNDQYAVKLANIYDALPNTASEDQTVAAFHRARTIFYSVNKSLERGDFEQVLVKNLRSKFQKKNDQVAFPGGVAAERTHFKQHRLTISAVISRFKNAIESRSISPFWKSRKANQLQAKPEEIAQSLLTLFILGLLERRTGHVFRELNSGTGFIDLVVMFSMTKHVLELKILTSKFKGASQLERYMKLEGRKEGWLIVFDSRPPAKKTILPTSIITRSGIIRVVQIDISPLAASKLP